MTDGDRAYALMRWACGDTLAEVARLFGVRQVVVYREFNAFLDEWVRDDDFSSTPRWRTPLLDYATRAVHRFRVHLELSRR